MTRKGLIDKDKYIGKYKDEGNDEEMEVKEDGKEIYNS